MKRKPTFSPRIGSLSSDRSYRALDYDRSTPGEDLIADLACRLRSLLQQCRVERGTRKAHVELLAHLRRASAIANAPNAEIKWTEALREALSHYAPPYTTFGERENERGETEWGFWPDDIDKLDAAGSLVKLTDHHDADELRVLWGEDVARVDDRGNVECGRFDKRGRWHEYWSCVLTGVRHGTDF